MVSNCILFEASRNREAILGIKILPDPVMRRAHPPAAHVEERQHRLLVSLRARDSSDHRHSRPLAILAGELLLCHHHPAVRVELYADGINGSDPIRLEMTRVRHLADAPGGYVYNAAVPAARPPADYTARIIPHCAGVAVPLEADLILWQR